MKEKYFDHERLDVYQVAIEIAYRLGITKLEMYSKARELLIRIVSMLSKMTLGNVHANGSETVTQTQTFTK